MNMYAGRWLGRFALALALAAVLAGSQGCAVAEYMRHRAEDALEMADVGLTVTSKPSLGLYWNSLDMLVGGYSKVDGHFVGLGGGRMGITRHYNHCSGFMVSHETVGWGDGFDKDKPETLYMRYGGLLGLASLGNGSTPDYTPACVHFFPHIGFVGFVWNVRWTQILDFALGWTTLDLANDDGHQFGAWPGRQHSRDQRTSLSM